MPSPFPGMDPYLEDPYRWSGVHLLFIGRLTNAINDGLPENYIALPNERLYVEKVRDILPDLEVKKLGKKAQKPISKRSGAVLVCDPPLKVSVESEHREGFIEIFPVKNGNRPVAVVEVLSPTNKTGKGSGFKLYRKKQREVLASSTHLVEIDLLRQGRHTVSAPRDSLLLHGAWDYLTSISHGGDRSNWDVWAVTVQERLPRIAIPLLPEDGEVVVDLQQVLDEVYDEGRYERILDYDDEPAVPLKAHDEGWADRLLRKKGLRS